MPPDAPLILAFDTSAAHCAAALVCGPKTLSSAREPMTRGQAERLMGLLEDTLADAGHTWRDLDALAVCTGPGNFTGTRISISAARGLALGLDIPAIGVSALEALASDTKGCHLAVVSAPRDQVYWQRFDQGAAVTDPALCALSEVPVTPDDRMVSGDAAPDVATALNLSHDRVRAGGQTATALARVAMTRLGTDQPRPAPLYLRPADAALPREAPPVILDDA